MIRFLAGAVLVVGVVASISGVAYAINAAPARDCQDSSMACMNVNDHEGLA